MPIYSLRLNFCARLSALAKQWVESDQVGLEGEQSLGSANVLKILVEKDFTCLTKRKGDEDLDTFPHPQEGMLCA